MITEAGFDTKKYIQVQADHISQRISASDQNPVFMEFGGKPFDDHHAERVLPGYDPDCKAELLSNLMPVGKIVMVVNARDILPPPYGRTPQQRIRGDSGLFYDSETIRLIKRARELDFEIKDVVVAVSPRQPSHSDAKQLDGFQERLARENITMHKHHEIPSYPNPDVITYADESFSQNDVIATSGNHLIAFSPGGGSGKFGVLLSELYHSLKRGDNPHFVKFETFPIFTKERTHALNLAFEAATADLQNRVIQLEVLGKDVVTSYDKDIENYVLLRRLFERYGNQPNTVADMLNPTMMSVNRIVDGITDESAIIEACRQEIMRRIKRYEMEVVVGVEKPSTLQRTREIYDIFTSTYGTSPLLTSR